MTGPTRAAEVAVVGRRRVLATAAAALATSLLAACGGRPGGRDGAEPAATPVDPTAPRAVTLAIVGILTADIDRSLRFYRQLGLDVPASAGSDSYRLRAADGHVLFWETADVVQAFDPEWELPPPADRRIVLDFGFAAATEVDATYRSLVAAGSPGRLKPFDLGGGIRYAIVEDPDGNQVSLRFPAS